jgi:predicted ATPase
MLRAIELENFKAFGQRTRISLAPITLIFGENSSGKSSILQSLALLKQTFNNRYLNEVLLPSIENGYVNLGGFRELISNHDLSRSFKIQLESDNSGIELIYNNASSKRIFLDQVSFFEGNPLECTVKFKKDKTYRQNNLPDGNRINYDANIQDLINKGTGYTCSWLTNSKTFWEPRFIRIKQIKQDLLGSLERDKQFFGIESKESKEVLAFLSSDFSYDDFVSRMRHYETGTPMVLLGLNIVGGPGCDYIGNWNHTFRNILFGSYYNNDYDDLIDYAEKGFGALSNILNSTTIIGPLRRSPERFYHDQGMNPRDVGRDGEFLPVLLSKDKELVKKINKWFKDHDVGYEIEIQRFKPLSEGLFSILLVDTRRKVKVGLSDLGFGISQILPFIAQSFIKESQIIAVEQPEIHVHPKLQADLGDLLVEGIKGHYGNQFIIETHSEHLILRLLRRIRETTEGELTDENLQLKPEDVSILYVRTEAEGSTIRQIPITPDGDFAIKWPNGFFTERAKELF